MEKEIENGDEREKNRQNNGCDEQNALCAAPGTVDITLAPERAAQTRAALLKQNRSGQHNRQNNFHNRNRFFHTQIS